LGQRGMIITPNSRRFLADSMGMQSPLSRIFCTVPRSYTLMNMQPQIKSRVIATDWWSAMQRISRQMLCTWQNKVIPDLHVDG